MGVRHIMGLPPYVFTIIDGLKQEARRAGRDAVDLGFGNPGLPFPATAVEKLAVAGQYSLSHAIYVWGTYFASADARQMPIGAKDANGVAHDHVADAAMTCRAR